MKCWTVYCHTHIESQRKYIGLTSQTMEKRWKKHVYAAKSSKGGRWHFPNAIRKYGKDAFESKVLGVYDTLEEANRIEKEKIKKFNTRDPKLGFNLAEGGNSKPHPIRKNPWNDPEYRAKQLARPNPLNAPEARANNKAALNTLESKTKRSATSKEVRSRPEVKAKMSISSASSKGRISSLEERTRLLTYAKGRVASSETREKLRTAMLGNKRSLGHKWTSETRQKVTNSLAKVRERINCKNRRYVTENECITHKICRVHGLVSISDCHIGKYENGNPRIECRLCMRQYNTRSKRKRKS
jgi:hypothetical protein